MRCKYGDHWLTGTPWNEDCGEVGWSAQQVTEVVPLVGAQTPFLAGHGNASEQISVPIILQEDDTLAALHYLVSLPWTLPTEDTLIFVEETSSNKLTITFPLAAWTGMQRKRIGSAIEVTYTFVVTGPPTYAWQDTSGLKLYSEDGQPLLTEDGQNILAE